MSPGTLLHDAGWALMPAQKVTENLTLTGVRTPNCPARSELLYRLRYHSRRSYGVKPQSAESDGSLLCLQHSGTPQHRLILALKHLLPFISHSHKQLLNDFVHSVFPHQNFEYISLFPLLSTS
jgi:hypothetical protein